MIFDWFKRLKHARGHGIHSPFAFHLITGVIYEKHRYYAFDDIEDALRKNQIETYNHTLHHLSYRLVRHFRPAKVLEINSPNGINALYINAANKEAVCHNPEFHQTNAVPLYDAIFIYPTDKCIDAESLFSMSSDDTFWVISGIKSGATKHFWRKIVKDDRARITFDRKNIGIVFLKKAYNKQNYLI